MLMEQVAHYNDLSPKLRKELEDKVRSYGKVVRYKFKISHENPDPEKYNGKIIWPARYTLDPRVFSIIDNQEDRQGKSRAKQVGIVDGVDEKGTPNRFKKIQVLGKDEGVLTLEPEEKVEDFAYALHIELHPKYDGGKFQDKKLNPIIFRIDEQKQAKEQREARSAKAKALSRADAMSLSDIKSFAAAMSWNENEDEEILKNKVESFAEEDPNGFNAMFDNNRLEYQAVVKRALDKSVISWDPVGGKVIDGKTQQVIVVLGVGDGSKGEVERIGEYFRTGGQKAEDIYKRIKTLSKV